MRRLLIVPVLAFALVLYPQVDPGGDLDPEARVDEVQLTSGPVEQGWGVQVETETDLVGVKWEGDPDATFTVEARNEDGEWEPAFEAGPPDGGPDPGTEESQRAAAAGQASEPVWLGDATAVRVRLAAGEASDVELVDVDSPEVTYPDDSAAAIPPQPGIVTRAQWGAQPPPCAPDVASSVKFAVVHHTAGSNNYSNGAAVVRGIDAYHISLGWCGIGYNFLVDKYGTVYEGRAGGITSTTVGAHAAPFNTNSTGVALIGNHETAGVSAAERSSLRKLLAWKLGLHHVNPLGFTTQNGKTIRNVVGHRDVNQTTCPGQYAYAQLPSLREELAWIIAVNMDDYRAIEERPIYGGWWELDGTGRVEPILAPDYGSPTFTGDIARDIAAMPDGKGYIVLDGWGGLHKYGSANQGTMKTLQGPFWLYWDIARAIEITPDGKGLLVLDGFGAVHTRGTAARVAGPYWHGWDIAKDVEMDQNGGVYILDGLGGIHQRNGAQNHGGKYWPNWNIARDLTVRADGSGYATLDGYGGVHNRGNMRASGNLGYAKVDRWVGLFYSELSGGYVGLRNDGAAAIG